MNLNPLTALPSALLAGSFLVLFQATPAAAQGTVFIGGSGKSPVEVNLDIIDGGPQAGARRMLKMPGTDEASDAPIKLRPPKGLKKPAKSVKLRLKKPAKPARKTVAKVRRVTTPAPTAKPKPKAVPVPVVKAKPVSQPKAIIKAPPKAVKPPPPPPVVAKKAPPPPPAKQKTPAKAAAPKKKTKLASLPKKAPPAVRPGIMRVAFTGASTRLSSEARSQLKALADGIEGSNARLQLKAYAGGTSDTPSSARRLSLSRALAVRSFLIESGVRSTRIDVRALGRAADQGPPDRVDVIRLVK